MPEDALIEQSIRTLATISFPNGTIDIWEDSNDPGRFFFYGDRNGMIQLGANLLRYAVAAKMTGSSKKAVPVTENGLFDTASQVQQVTFQLDEAARAAAERIQRKRRSLGLFWRLFDRRRSQRERQRGR